jgi:hypothetical protein
MWAYAQISTTRPQHAGRRKRNYTQKSEFLFEQTTNNQNEENLEKRKT